MTQRLEEADKLIASPFGRGRPATFMSSDG
jgi:hypothetical protein